MRGFLSEEMMRAYENNHAEPARVLAEVMERFRGRWFKFVLRILQNAADAEDALQEGFCRVLASNRFFNSEEDTRLYLARTISNTAIEIYHLRRREKQSHCPAHEYQLPDQFRTTPLGMLDRIEARRKRDRVLGLLDQALRKLPLKQYEALRMTVMDTSFSIRDVGEATGIAYSTLRHRRVQGLRRLRRYLCRALRNDPMKVILA
jgi:RNA polymerase sigma factor (sigma-70 family)